ncbi:hypothetical protein Q5424_24530 [Conexibacter sp. JD483]|uniref:hypothetical protein n=1 Tax=unclassified Conexibacter TaxID=2627773 RepID=UPI0027228DDC|nr:MULTISPECIES: hypothetical protein [unclassified Conexibacter]MDO8186493.1 hypothetical protein [Conexibacter sp. CPCC 205706]MDO8200062.1 hypothetical protein [Conexibacter sp. CPCC 205762]MDR9372288.1 hypothetical protein [Conexibacter sp. JD483]
MTQRRRAPHRAGRRTTLTVPPEVYTQAELLAHELGTTTNDALIHLAGEGVALRERRRRFDALAAERGTAIDLLDTSVRDLSDFPSPAELREAMLSGRREDDVA